MKSRLSNISDRIMAIEILLMRNHYLNWYFPKGIWSKDLKDKWEKYCLDKDISFSFNTLPKDVLEELEDIVNSDFDITSPAINKNKNPITRDVISEYNKKHMKGNEDPNKTPALSASGENVGNFGSEIGNNSEIDAIIEKITEI